MEKWPRQGGDGAKIAPHGSNRGQGYLKTKDGMALRNSCGHPHRLEPSPVALRARAAGRQSGRWNHVASLIRPERYNSSRGNALFATILTCRIGSRQQSSGSDELVVLSLSGVNLARLASNILNSALNQSERNPLLFEPHLFAKSIVDEGIE
jgi:hypothetical protein